MKSIKLFLSVAFASLLLIGCEGRVPQPTPPADVVRTVIVYMVADNNLNRNAVDNINAMELAFSDQYGTKVLLFYNDNVGNCRIYDIAKDDDPTKINSKIVREYPFKTNPCVVETLSAVIADCRQYSPTASYSMIFWSHGTGWLPQGMSPARIIAEENPSEREQLAPQYTFGSVNSFNDQLEIWELAEALPKDLVFDYINFDACYMSCIELVYQLRHNARYIMASAAEILAAGYPYDQGMKDILMGDVKGMSNVFFDHYNSQSGVWRSATTAVVDCSKLDAVASELKKLVATGGELQTEQEFGRNLGSRSNYSDLLWDLGQMATLTWGDDARAFNAALDAAVVYKGATPMLFEGDYYGDIKVDAFCGVTVYKPRLSQPKTLEIYTTHYDWANDTQLYLLAR